MPERCLKKLVMALWSLKLRWSAISPMVMSEWARRLQISLYISDVTWSYTVDQLSGRSGRILELVAISEIIGRSE